MTVAIVLLSGCCSGKVSVTAQKVCGQDAYELRNQYVAADIVPDMSGIFVHLRSKNGSRWHRMTKPLVCSVTVDDLLPEIYEQNDAGGRACLWGHPIRVYQLKTLRAEVDRNGNGHLEMNGRYWLSTNLSMTRCVKLKPDRSMFTVVTKVTNIGKEPVTVSLWENFSGLLITGIHADELIFPVRGNVSRIGKDGTRHFPEDQLARKNPGTDKGVYRLPPNGNWMARRQTNAPLLVLRFPQGLGKNGMFYTHYGAEPTVNTSEAIREPFTLKPGESGSFEIEYLVFAGLDNMNAFCGDVVINCCLEKDEIVFQLASFRKLDPGKLRLPNIGESEVGLLSPGDSRSIRFKRPASLEKNIQGVLSNVGDFSCYIAEQLKRE